VSQHLCILEKNAEKLVEDMWKQLEKKIAFILQMIRKEEQQKDERKN